MARTPEIRDSFIPQVIIEHPRRTMSDPIRIQMVNEYRPPKKLVFREDASFLSPAEQAIIQGVIEGGTYKQIAWKRQMSHRTVKNHISNIGKRLQEEEFDFPNDEIKTNIILALLITGELELR